MIAILLIFAAQIAAGALWYGVGRKQGFADGFGRGVNLVLRKWHRITRREEERDPADWWKE